MLQLLLLLASSRPQKILFSKDWVCRWPRPSDLQDVPVMEFEYLDDGIVDMSSLFQNATEATHSVVRHWGGIVFNHPVMAIEKGKIRLEILLKNVFRGPENTWPFLAQIVLAIAVQVENALDDIDTMDPDTRDWGEGFSSSKQGVMANSSCLDKDIFDYVSGCVAEGVGKLVIGVATDKANPCSGSFFNTVVTYGNGKLALLPPGQILFIQQDLCRKKFIQQFWSSHFFARVLVGLFLGLLVQV